jgi:hypothetical protein
LDVDLPSRTGASLGSAAYACCNRATDSAYAARPERADARPSEVAG